MRDMLCCVEITKALVHTSEGPTLSSLLCSSNHTTSRALAARDSVCASVLPYTKQTHRDMSNCTRSVFTRYNCSEHSCHNRRLSVPTALHLLVGVWILTVGAVGAAHPRRGIPLAGAI